MRRLFWTYVSVSLAASVCAAWATPRMSSAATTKTMLASSVAFPATRNFANPCPNAVLIQNICVPREAVGLASAKHS